MTTRAKSPLCEEVPIIEQPQVIDAAVAEKIKQIESVIESNVQSSLDSMDAWKLVDPVFGRLQKTPSTCSAKEHKCNLSDASTSGNQPQLCVGCKLYKDIVLNRSSFVTGGRTDLCDAVSGAIAKPIILAFLSDGRWLAPLSESKSRWFVSFPITYHLKQPSQLGRSIECTITRNRVRLFEADALLRSLGIPDIEAVYKALPSYWSTAAGGPIYTVQDLLELFGPIVQYSSALNTLGLMRDSSADMNDIVRKIASLKLE